MTFSIEKKRDEEIQLESTTSNSHLDKHDLKQVNSISEMLNHDEKVLLVARQSKIKPGGSFFTPNTIYATDRRLIIRDPYMLGIKSEIIDIPYDVITSLKIEKGLLSSTIKFKAPSLMNSTKLGMADNTIEGENDQEGIIEAISKKKADDLLEIIRSGITTRSNIDRNIQHTVPQSEKQIEEPIVDNESNESNNNSETFVDEHQEVTPYQQQKQPEEAEESNSKNISNNTAAIVDELCKLASLKKEGMLTEQEFNSIKQKILSKD